jgi:hypothetical protein
MNKLIDAIESAYCWEGGASATHQPKASSPNFLVFSVCGSSTCENGGDVDSIRSMVRDLRGQSFTEDNVTYTIESASCEIGSREYERDEDTGEIEYDGDFSVSVSGRVTVREKRI